MAFTCRPQTQRQDITDSIVSPQGTSVLLLMAEDMKNESLKSGLPTPSFKAELIFRDCRVYRLIAASCPPDSRAAANFEADTLLTRVIRTVYGRVVKDVAAEEA